MSRRLAALAAVCAAGISASAALAGAPPGAAPGRGAGRPSTGQPLPAAPSPDDRLQRRRRLVPVSPRAQGDQDGGMRRAGPTPPSRASSCSSRGATPRSLLSCRAGAKTEPHAGSSSGRAPRRPACASSSSACRRTSLRSTSRAAARRAKVRLPGQELMGEAHPITDPTCRSTSSSYRVGDDVRGRSRTGTACLSSCFVQRIVEAERRTMLLRRRAAEVVDRLGLFAPPSAHMHCPSQPLACTVEKIGPACWMLAAVLSSVGVRVVALRGSRALRRAGGRLRRHQAGTCSRARSSRSRTPHAGTGP